MCCNEFLPKKVVIINVVLYSEGDYLLAKSIVQSGQTDEEWNLLRQGKGNWPSSKVTWKQFRAYSLDELKEEMKLYKQIITGKIFSFIIIFIIFQTACTVLLIRFPLRNVLQVFIYVIVLFFQLILLFCFCCDFVYFIFNKALYRFHQLQRI
jgi:hypothetical protein